MHPKKGRNGHRNMEEHHVMTEAEIEGEGLLANHANPGRGKEGFSHADF